MNDMWSRGRGLKGAAHGSAKLSEADIVQIRARSESAKATAVKFGISKSHVWAVRRGDFWKHL